MNNVVVIFPDGREQYFENATLELINYPPRTVVIKDQGDELLGVFNFEHIAGVRMI